MKKESQSKIKPGKLSLSELDYLHDLVQKLPGNVYWKSREGIYLGCNENCAKSIHLDSPQDIIGKTIQDLFPPDMAAILAHTDEQVIARNTELVLEETGFAPNGVATTYLTRKTPIHDSQGNVIGLMGVSLDITERKQLEETLKATQQKLAQESAEKTKFIGQMKHLEEIIALIPGNVYWKNRDGIYLGCNEDMAKILHLSKPREIIGKTIYDLLPPNMHASATVTAKEDAVIMAENHEKFFEESGLDTTSQPAIYLTKKAPLHNEAGKVIGLIGVSIDITQQKKLEEALKTAKEKAEQISQIKLDFIRNMEHDIRTPFSGVYGMSKILFEAETDPEKKDFLGDIYHSAEELLDFCNKILEFSKMETGTLPVLAKPFDIKDLIERAVKALKPAAQLKNLALIVEYEEKIQPIFIGDDYRLYRILLNLLGNAVKFTKVGHVKIKVKNLKRTERQAILSLTIEDTGIGIPEEKKLFIYEKFSRLNPSNKGIYKGLGLGLRTVKQFVEEMSGELTMQSEIDKGTIFTAMFPLPISLLSE